MICVSVGNINYSGLIDLLNEEDLVEIRLDMNSFSDDELSSIFSSPADTIATYRPGSLTEKERIRKLGKCIESGASYVDLELEAGENTFRNISEMAKKDNCRLIVSYHNHEGTPSSAELKNIYKLCLEKGGDIVKIACNANSVSDNARLLSLYDDEKISEKGGLIVIGMGEIGKVTRLAIPLLGAPFTYASIEKSKETADGQIEKSTLEKIYKLIKDEK